MKKIWIIDDEPSIRFTLKEALSREGMPVELFSSAESAINALGRTKPQVIVSDIRMPGESGIDLLKHVNNLTHRPPVIIMTAYSDLDSAVSAFQEGAFDYLPKPFDITDAVKLIRRAADESLKNANLGPEEPATHEMLGQAPAMQDLFRAIGKLSQSLTTVLITGASGTGKELVAKALHQHSQRSKRPFIAINTAAIPKDLLESELFGHEKGSFTGAQTMREGRFEQASSGTLFLDEIGDMPSELQTRLLRVISDNHFYRVGGRELIKANVRIIAATHQNLEQRVKDGLFREDLFHRLNVIRLEVPNLKDRRADIKILADFFMKKSAFKLATEQKLFTKETLNFLQQLDWPGNVRQLENTCHWVTVMSPGSLVNIKDLPPDLLAKTESSENKSWTKALRKEANNTLNNGELDILLKFGKEFERILISQSLNFTSGKKIEASKLLGIGRNTLTRKIKELGIEDKGFSEIEANLGVKLSKN